MAALARDDLDTWGQSDLSGLPLPGPTVVIDMRPQKEMYLLAYLATEIVETAREAHLREIAGWERLDACFAFLKSGVSRTSSFADTEECFEITPVGQPPEHFFTARAFITRLGEQIRAVRNRRIQALQQYERAASQPGSYRSDLERVTVRILVLLDLSEPASAFEREVQHLARLKAWCEDDFGWEHAGRGKLLEINAVCFNAHPRLLRKRLEGPASATFQSVILIGSYREDYGHLSEHAQTSHAELILSALLLHWPEAMQPSIEDIPLASTSTGEGPASAYSLPRPTYLLGAAGLEEPTRWGARWLHYGLTATMLEVLLDRQQLFSEERSLRLDVQQWFNTWWQLTKSNMPRLWFNHIQRLQGLARLEQLRQEHLRERSPTGLSQRLQRLAGDLHHLYVGCSDTSLEAALASLEECIAFSRQLDPPESWTPRHWQRYQEELSAPGKALEVFLVALFPQIRGCIPRARRQVDLLRELIERELRPLESWQPQAAWRELEAWEQRAQEELRRLITQLGGRRWKKNKLTKACEVLQQELRELLDRHYQACSQALAARFALALLQEAGLYDPESTLCPCAERLEQLEQQLRNAHIQAGHQQRIASHRLSLGASRLLPPLDPEADEVVTLHNRENLLPVEELGESYERAYRQFTAKPPGEFGFFRFLAEALLRHLGNNQMKQGNNYRAPVFVPSSEEAAWQHLEVLEAVIVAAFIAARAGTPETLDLAPLLARRQEIQRWLLAPPNALDTTLPGLREIVRFTRLEQAIARQFSRASRLQTLSVEQVLADLLANQPRDEQLQNALDASRFPAFLVDQGTNRENLLRELDRQSVLASHFARHDLDEAVYLYMPASADSTLFKQVFDDLHLSNIPIIPIPAGEKMLYLRVNRLRQFYQSPDLSAHGENSPNAEKRKD